MVVFSRNEPCVNNAVCLWRNILLVLESRLMGEHPASECQIPFIVAIINRMRGPNVDDVVNFDMLII
jgi:hypothetical protein